ncbi:MAG: hypothetical protein HOI17_00045 [Alphaproteobacteria bacterium]|nr:hypothetical protein [Alphaproteobacteria bacterium]
MKQAIVLFCFFVVGMVTIFTGFYIWEMLGPISLSIHGWLAIIAGIIGSFVLGSGLMALSFYSSRSGHDAKVADYDPFQSKE